MFFNSLQCIAISAYFSFCAEENSESERNTFDQATGANGIAFL